MKHNEPIQPTPAAQPIPSLPNRTDLSKLYPEVKKAGEDNGAGDSLVPQEGVSPYVTRPLIFNRLVVSLLLFLPVLSVCLLVLFISQNASKYPPDPLSSLHNFYATGICLLLCVVSFRSLAKQFEACNISLSIFTVMYLFYLFPTLKLTYGLLQGGGVGVIVALGLLLGLTGFAVAYMTWALNRESSSYGNRMLIVALPIAILTVSVSLF